jgi:FKBP-type peptidyl-prolyl cis-trans isomerase
MMSSLYKIAFLALILYSASCSVAQPEENQQQEPKSSEELLIEQNRESLKQERLSIEAFIKQNDFTMMRTGSGLYYMRINESRNPMPIAVEDEIEYAYRISLLDGTPIRNSVEDGNRFIRVGKDQVEIGLHEAFLLMNLGERMLFIIPAHLAHGISQNEDDVPPRSTLLYELEPLKKLN